MANQAHRRVEAIFVVGHFALAWIRAHDNNLADDPLILADGLGPVTGGLK